MKISNFKYLVTDTGGGWSTIHKFYGITHNGEVYTTESFNDTIFQLDAQIDCEYLGKLNSLEIGLKDESELHYGVMDASDLTLYEVGETFKILHYAPEITENNPKIYYEIQKLILAYRDSKIADKHTDTGEFIIGEVKTADEIKNVLNLLNKGHIVHTTFHALDCKDVIDNMIKRITKDGNEVERKELLENYFKNQHSMGEFFDNIKQADEKHELKEPTMQDILVHALKYSPKKVESSHIESRLIKLPYGYGMLTNNCIIRGNYKVEEEIKELTEKHVDNKVNLYDAQHSIKEQLIEKYGADFYDKNAEAINFIIEGTYSTHQSNRHR